MTEEDSNNDSGSGSDESSTGSHSSFSSSISENDLSPDQLEQLKKF